MLACTDTSNRLTRLLTNGTCSRMHRGIFIAPCYANLCACLYLAIPMLSVLCSLASYQLENLPSIRMMSSLSCLFFPSHSGIGSLRCLSTPIDFSVAFSRLQLVHLLARAKFGLFRSTRPSFSSFSLLYCRPTNDMSNSSYLSLSSSSSTSPSG